MTPALRNHHPSIGKIPGIHIDEMKDSAPPNPSKPPKTILMVLNSASPQRMSIIARIKSATAHPRIQEPRSGADSTPTYPVAKAKIPKCNAPSRYKLAIPPEAHSCVGLEVFSDFTLCPPFWVFCHKVMLSNNIKSLIEPSLFVRSPLVHYVIYII